MRRLFGSALALSVMLLEVSSSWAQTAITYTLPAQPADVAVFSNGTVVSTLTNTPSLWLRSSDNSLRIPDFGDDAVDVVVTRSGSKAFAVSQTSTTFYVFEIGSDQASVRWVGKSIAFL